MQRGRYNTVTEDLRLPVLIPATPEQEEGLATFAQELGSPQPVRTLKNSDLKDARKHFGASEVLHFHAVIALTQALQHPSDSIALQKAKDVLDKAYTLRRAEPGSLSPTDPRYEEFASGLARLIGVSPQEAVEVFDRKRPGPRAAADPRWLLSYEVSDVLIYKSQLVLWWTGTRFTPAIWCDDINTAFYVRALLGAFGGKGLRICPHCSQPFFQDRPDQNYCSVAHREAHRVARWRAAKVLKSKRKKKGGKNVTRKTR